MKRYLIKTAVFVVIAAAIGLACYVSYYYIKYPVVFPAPDVTVKLTPENLEKGRYLSTHVYVCFECHTPRNRDFFASPLVMEKHGMGGEKLKRDESEGVFYTSNLTPAALGDWTDGEIIRAINEGVSRDGKPLYWGMPSGKYKHMPQDHLEAIVAYLRTLSPISADIPRSDPSWRIWKDMRTWQEKAEPRPAPQPSDSLEYGHFLVKMASCEGCHAHIDKNGEYFEELGLSGGYEFNMYDRKDIVRGANITPDAETGIGRWTKQQFIQRFKMYATPEGQKIPAKEGQFQTPMHWTMYGGMSEQDLGAIYYYLMAQKPVKHSVVVFEAGR